jgi:hypothetical protein
MARFSAALGALVALGLMGTICVASTAPALGRSSLMHLRGGEKKPVKKVALC